MFVGYVAGDWPFRRWQAFNIKLEIGVLRAPGQQLHIQSLLLADSVCCGTWPGYVVQIRQCLLGNNDGHAAGPVSTAVAKCLVCRYRAEHSDERVWLLSISDKIKKTTIIRRSADADKPARRVCRSVNVSKHSTIPYVTYTFLLCNSNYSTSKMSWPWKPGQSSLKDIESASIR